MKKLFSQICRIKKSILYSLLLIGIITIFFVQPNIESEIIRLNLSIVFNVGILLLLFLLGIHFTHKWLMELGYKKREYRLLFIIVIIVAILGCAFFVLFFSSEQNIRVYDPTVYWIKVIEGREKLASSIPEYFEQLLATFTHEYNNLAAFPLLSVSYLFGIQFTGFCISIFLIYYIPACFFLTVFVLRLLKKAYETNMGIRHFLICFLITILSTGLFWGVINGRVDVAGVLIIAIMLNASLNWKVDKFDLKNIALFSFLSVLLLLTRRWFAYYIVGFYMAFGISKLVQMIMYKEISFKKVLSLVISIASVAILSCILIFLIKPEIFKLFLNNDYSLAYSAYKNTNFLGNTFSIMGNLGIIFIAIVIIGIILGVTNNKIRFTSIYIALASIIAMVLFCLVQDMDYHHYYLILPMLLIFYCFAIGFLIEVVKKKKLTVFLCILLSLANFSYGYISSFQSIANASKPYMNLMHTYPQRYKDYDEIKEIVKDLNEKIADTSKQIYVIGDGPEFSAEILKRSHMPDVIDSTPYVLESHIVDLRDGFPSQLFLAEYILITDPFYTSYIQTQQVSYQIYDMLLNDPEIKEYYSLDKIYNLSERDALLFKKVKQVDLGCVNILKQRLMKFYPEDSFVYEPNYFVSLIDIEDNTKYSYSYWENLIRFKKSQQEAISFSFEGVEEFKEISFSITAWTEGLELIAIDSKGEIDKTPIQTGEQVNYTIKLRGDNSLKIYVKESLNKDAVSAEVLLYFNENSLIK